MDPQTFLDRLKRQGFYAGQVVHVRPLPARAATFADPPGGLEPRVRQALERQGIGRLYAHQARALGEVRRGRHVVVVTGTASGKTLCYVLPTVEAILDSPLSTALYLYPTKALAQDQLRALGGFLELEGAAPMLAGTYDGDTPQNLRRRLRDAANIVLTNPDMLHQGILPHHARWNRFFTHLRYVVIDELHAYRGVFGSHLANVIRRLDRICEHYGSSPVFICCSATIGNPKEHAERVTGRSIVAVTDDGAPRGPRHFVLWNPPPLRTAAHGAPEDWRVGGDRRSPLWEAVHLLTRLVMEGIQTIAFVRTRLAAELLLKNARDLLRGVSRKLANAVHAYRGGYLPEERREIERKLERRAILGVASTNALELGIDIRSLEASLLVGYPGTIASLWQQAGRAGRGREPALTFLIAQNAPIDQYLMTHRDYLFAQSPEQAVIDPDNPHVTVGHLKCAAHELPLASGEVGRFGALSKPLLELLGEEEYVRHIDGHWYWACSNYPAAEVNLRNIAGPVYTIQDESKGERVIGTLDESSALAQLHTHAVYLHGAETYFVNRLDLEQKIAFVERRDLDYYTQSVQVSQIRIDDVEEERDWRGAAAGFGEVTVTTTLPMFKKIRFHSRDSLGFEKLELPPQELETVAMWLCPPAALAQEMQSKGHVLSEGLIGIANVLVEILPFFIMCDPQDIGTVVNSSSLKRDALFLHDRYPGGMGYARRCLERLEEVMRAVRDVVVECSCADGCPSCVGAPVPPFALSDLDTAVRGRIPDKAAARMLLEALLG